MDIETKLLYVLRAQSAKYYVCCITSMEQGQEKFTHS